MSRRLVRSGVLITVISVMQFGPSTAHAAIPDASCAPPGPSSTLLANTPDGRNAQPFTAIHTGLLVQAQFPINKVQSFGDFQLQLLAADPGGTPINGVLGFATIPDASVPMGQTTLTGTFSSPASVIAGRQYALVVTRPGGNLYAIGERSDDPCPFRAFISDTQTGTWSGNEPTFDYLFQTLVEPTNAFTIGAVKKRTLTLTVPGPGAISVANGGGGGKSAVASAKKKLLKTSTATAVAVGTVKVKLKLTKLAKRLLAAAGKLKAKAAVTYTPTGGDPNTQRKKLKFKQR